MLKDLIILIIFIIYISGCKENTIKNETNRTILGEVEKNATLQTEQSPAIDEFQEDQNQTPTSFNENETDIDQESPTIEHNTSWQEFISQIDLKFYDETDVVYPHFMPKGENLIGRYIDPSFEKDSSNLHLYGSSFDMLVKRSGERSVHIDDENDSFVIDSINVEEGKWYVISAYMLTDSLPQNVIRYYVEFTKDGKGVDIPNYPVVSISKENEWEEFILPVYIKKNSGINGIKILFRNIGQRDAKEYLKSSIWIDDISLFEVESSSKLFGLTKPMAKRSFDGSLVHVDSLGNFSLKKNEHFEAFFPIVIYPGGKESEWKKYKEKGFNTVICNSIAQAKIAVRAGMHWVWSLYDYGIYDANISGYERFEKEYLDIRKNQPKLFENLLYFYWDNERYLLFDTVKKFSDMIKRLDIDESGKRFRPFLMQLDFSTANTAYINEKFSLVDLQGCYANPMIFEDNDPQNYQGVEFKGNYDGEFANFSIFENIPGVRIPKTVFVINSPFGDKHLENTIYTAIARGGKGFAYWKDSGSQPAIETKEWWDDFEKISTKLQSLLPLIRTPHWTKWKIEASLPDDEDGLVLSSRNLEDRKCIIVASRSDKSENIKFTISDSEDSFEGRSVIDYFSTKVVAIWENKSFELILPPRGNGVYCW